MGKIIDFIFADNWEEYQRIQLYKKLGNSQFLNQNKEEKSPQERIDEWKEI